MTEQRPPSAEALEIVDGPLAEVLRLSLASEIDALIAQRVSAETERWQNRDRQRLEQIDRLQEAVQSLQNASAERPAPAIRDTLARLGEPGVREAVIDALMTTTGWVSSFPGKLPLVAAGLADAAIAKIAETLK